VVTFPAVAVEDPALLLRAIEVYELDRLDFAEAYLVACAERSGSTPWPASTRASAGSRR
jgi:hypothetical protein